MNKLPRIDVEKIETDTLAYWQENKIFEQSLEKNPKNKSFSFYDGPPFANGLPHFGHSLVTSIKDAIGRYKTMRGFYVERRNGWDCHGLPVEYEIEKKFGVSGKKQILELGLDKFNQACRDSVFTYKKEWEDFFDRIGRWTDKENAYATINNDFIESVWWALAQVHKKGLLYRGFKSMPYCPRCETPLSNFELNEGYKDGVSDPSLYVKFKLKDADEFFLAWTTTPWSLPGNAALAVDPTATYVKVTVKDDDGNAEHLILVKNRLEVLDAQYEIVEEMSGEKLVGLHYEPLFATDKQSDNLYKVWAAEFVSIEDGTGVLHVAPAFGEDDLNLGQRENIPVLMTVGPDGRMTTDYGIAGLSGMFFKEADQHIIEHLAERGMVYSAQTLQHTYGFCYRCDSPLLYYAISTWFVKVSQIRSDLLKTAQDVNWTPAHVKTGRFGKWLEGARDWAISRNRYWGSPMPIWQNVEDPSDYIVVESLAELKELVGGELELTDLHRPGIDSVEFQKDGKTYRRIEEVLDCWFESGSMPYAQAHYPFSHEAEFKQSFPADYIGEGLDQTRLWFYVLHVLSTILFEKPAYQNVVVNGMIMAADGQKLSKRLKNYPPIEDVFSREGADSLRYYLLSSPATVGEYMRFSRDGLADINRNIFMTLYNTASFLSMYAEVDGWQPKGLARPDVTHPLDVWLLNRLAQTAQLVAEGADSYDLGRATRPLAELVDDLSNWYVRRSRRRFWKSDNDGDKTAAYETLHFALVTTCQLFAPWSPFMSDYLYRHLTTDMTGVPESVHLTDWPELGAFDQTVLDQMAALRQLVSDGLSQRAEAKIKTRQPLASAKVTLPFNVTDELNEMVREELNIKSLDVQSAKTVMIEMNTEITQELQEEGAMRDIIRFVQSARKQAGLEISDRILLHLSSDDELMRNAIEHFGSQIAEEVLAVKIVDSLESADFSTAQKIGGGEVSLQLQKHV